MSAILMRERDADAGQRSAGALIAVSLALFCIQVDFFALNLALPNMAAAFHVGARGIQWTVSAYMLSVGSLFILAGRVGDIFGRRRALLAGIAIFGLASLACAVAPSLGVLIAARVVQGAGAAVVFPVGVAVVSNSFGEEARARALGFAFGIANIGSAAGPFIGGGLSGGPGWRWVFWTLLALCVVAFLAALLTVSDSREAAAPRRLDAVGATLVISAVALLSVTVDRGEAWGWGSAGTIGGFVIAGALLAAFVAYESRVRAPLVDLKLFRNYPYVLVTAMGMVANIVYVVSVFVVTLYLQEVRGLSPLTAGVVFLAPSLLVAASGPLGGRLEKVFRPTAVMAAAGVVSGVGVLAMSFAHGWAAYVPCFAFAGLGFGLGWTFASVGTQSVVVRNAGGGLRRTADDPRHCRRHRDRHCGDRDRAARALRDQPRGRAQRNAQGAGDRDHRCGMRGDGASPPTGPPGPDRTAIDEGAVHPSGGMSARLTSAIAAGCAGALSSKIPAKPRMSGLSVSGA